MPDFEKRNDGFGVFQLLPMPGSAGLNPMLVYRNRYELWQSI
ncbi:hypothetical protein [Gracilimonas sp.]